MRAGSRVSTWKPLPHLKLGLTHRIDRQRQSSLSGHLSNRLNTAPPVLEGQGLSLLCQGLHKPIHNPGSQGILTVGVLLEAPG